MIGTIALNTVGRRIALDKHIRVRACLISDRIVEDAVEAIAAAIAMRHGHSFAIEWVQFAMLDLILDASEFAAERSEVWRRSGQEEALKGSAAEKGEILAKREREEELSLLKSG